MKSMIDNLLLFSELGSAEVTVEPVDMQIVVSLVLARFYDRIRERGVTVEVTPELPRAMGYSPWLEEVFANLIDNSIKYMGEDNPAPRIIVWGERAGDWARFEIIDNGVGIEEADQQRLFQMFTRFHRHHADGSGLGLSIARRIVEKLGGRIGVESEPGRGTKFWIELPPAGKRALAARHPACLLLDLLPLGAELPGGKLPQGTLKSVDLVDGKNDHKRDPCAEVLRGDRPALRLHQPLDRLVQAVGQDDPRLPPLDAHRARHGLQHGLHRLGIGAYQPSPAELRPAEIPRPDDHHTSEIGPAQYRQRGAARRSGRLAVVAHPLGDCCAVAHAVRVHVVCRVVELLTYRVDEGFGLLDGARLS